MRRSKKGIICVLAGLLLIGYAFLIWGSGLWDEAHAGEKADDLLARAAAITESRPEAAQTPLWDDFVPDCPDEHEAVDGILGILEIPALELKLPVQSEYAMKSLRTSPCRYRGRYQDMKNLAICAHNYERHFGRLKDLSEGDEITFTYLDCQKVTYKIGEILTIEPDDFDSVESPDWDLCLFTCTTGGAKRVMIHGRQISGS